MRTVLAGVVGMGLWGWAAGVIAQSGGGGMTPDSSCATDADCPASYTCEVVGMSDCGWVCPPDQPDCPRPPDCPPDPSVIYGCVPGPCGSDADCGEGYHCFTDSWSTCSGAMDPAPGVPCMPGTDCTRPPPPEECMGYSTSYCAPRPVPPCVEDADCGPGLRCEAVATGGCGCACPEGAMCECPDCEPPPDLRECVPAPCMSDSDCGDMGLVCVTVTYDECDIAPCPDPMDPRGCDAEPACRSISEGYCAPPYVAPCMVDADCGDHFRCSAAENCACPAGMEGGFAPPGDPGIPPEEGGVPAPPSDGDCTCEPTGDLYCELIPIACVNEADCPDGWSCLQYAIGAPCYMNPDGTTTCPGGESGGQCVPPAWAGGWAPEGNGSREAFARATGAADARATGSAPSPGDHYTYDGGCNASATSTTGHSGWLSLLGLLSALALVRRRKN